MAFDTYPTTANRMQSVVQATVTQRSFTYDGAGNLLSDARSGTTYAYTYNNANRLKTVSAGVTLVGTYTYNGMEQLITRIVTNSGAADGTTHFIHDQFGNIIAELNSTGATVKEYIWLPEAEIAPTRQSRAQVDIPLAVVDAVNTATPVLYMVHADHLARPVRITNSIKAAVWSSEYTPSGAPHVLSGTVVMDARFPGQWFQLEAGLHYNWHRHYDPSLGRYTQPDPLGFVDGPSVFAYGKDAPLMFVDKDGRNALDGAIKGGRIGGSICGPNCAAAGAVLGGAVGLGLTCMAIYKESKRCKQVRRDCYNLCEGADDGDRANQGNPFFRCVNQCLFDNKCGGTNYKND